MTEARHVCFCDMCGTRLRPDNPLPLCAECQWEERNIRLLRRERENRAARRRSAVQRHIRDLDNGKGTA